MMARLAARGAQLAKARQRAQVQRIAALLARNVAGAKVTAEETRVLLVGKGLIKRWLIDPQLRFLSGDLK